MNLATETIEYLERNGWIKGEAKTAKGTCLAEAMGLVCATYNFLGTEGFHKAVMDVIEAEFDCPRSIVQFNDSIYTTYEDIIKVLEKAAARLDEEVV